MLVWTVLPLLGVRLKAELPFGGITSFDSKGRSTAREIPLDL